MQLVECHHCSVMMEVASRNFKSCADCKKALAKERNKKYAATSKRKDSHARYEEKRSKANKEATTHRIKERDMYLLPRALRDTFADMDHELQCLVLEQARDARYGDKISHHGRRISLDTPLYPIVL